MTTKHDSLSDQANFPLYGHIAYSSVNFHLKPANRHFCHRELAILRWLVLLISALYGLICLECRRCRRPLLSFIALLRIWRNERQIGKCRYPTFGCFWSFEYLNSNILLHFDYEFFWRRWHQICMIGVIYERVSGPGLCHLYLLRFLLVRGCHTDFLGLWIAFQQFTVADFEWFIIKSKLSFVPFSFWPWNWTSHELRQCLYFPKRGKFHQSFVGWECLFASYSDVLFAITAICLSRRSLHSPLFD